MKNENIIAVSLPDLEEIVRLQDGWDYNRQLEPTYLDGESARNGNHQLLLIMPHSWKHFEPCETHYRTLLTREDKIIVAFIDMPIEFWNGLCAKGQQ